MRSLNAHLTEAGSHGFLPFHPGCPVCRAERLAGRVGRGRVISQRAQASLLAAVLALSAGGPAAPALFAAPPGDEGARRPTRARLRARTSRASIRGTRSPCPTRSLSRRPRRREATTMRVRTAP